MEGQRGGRTDSPSRRQFPAADVSTLSEAVPGDSGSAGGPGPLLPPLLADTESPFDLEQQWQDLMSIMEMQVSSGGGVGKAFAPPGRFRFGGCAERSVPGQSRFGVGGSCCGFVPACRCCWATPERLPRDLEASSWLFLAKDTERAGLERGCLTELFLVSSRRWK